MDSIFKPLSQAEIIQRSYKSVVNLLRAIQGSADDDKDTDQGRFL